MVQQFRRLADSHRVAGWLLVAGGALYAFFWGAAVFGDIGDALWVVALAAHATLIVLIVTGLVMARSRLRLDGWASWVWNASTVLAFLGQTVGHPIWSLALFGLGAVVFTKFGFAVAAPLAAGGLGWLLLFWSGVRVGDENSPTPTDGQTVLAVTAIMLMALGLIRLGLSLRRSVTAGHDVSLKP